MPRLGIGPPGAHRAGERLGEEEEKGRRGGQKREKTRSIQLADVP